MRAVFLLLPLVLLGCKPDPIEACVQAERKKYLLNLCELIVSQGKECSSDDKEYGITLAEPSWRQKCMRAAAGKED